MIEIFKVKNRFSLMVLFLIFLSFSLLAKPAKLTKTTNFPIWIDNPESFYQKSEYFFAVGTSQEKENAKNQAVAEIAAIFGSDVKSEVESKKSLKNDKSQAEMSLSQTVNISIIQDDFLGIEVAESYYDKKTDLWYVLVVMDKKKTFDLYTQRIFDNDKAIKVILSDENPNKNDFAYFFDLKKAKEIMLNVERDVSRCSVINFQKSVELQKEIIKSSELESACRNFADKNPVYVYVSGDKSGKIEYEIKNALNASGLKVSTNSQENIKFNSEIQYTEWQDEITQTFFCEYSVSSYFYDKSANRTFSENQIKGRQGGLSAERAKDTAIKKICMELNTF